MKSPKLNGAYEVVTSVDINAPMLDAWKVLRDFHNVSWAPGVKASHAIGKSEIGVGAGRHCTLDGFGEIDEYITQWFEGQGFVYSLSPLGPLHQAQSSWCLEQLGDSNCRLKLVLSYDIRFSVLGKFMHLLLMRKKLEGSLPQTAQAVKDRVERDYVVSIPMAQHSLAS